MDRVTKWGVTSGGVNCELEDRILGFAIFAESEDAIVLEKSLAEYGIDKRFANRRLKDIIYGLKADVKFRIVHGRIYLYKD